MDWKKQLSSRLLALLLTFSFSQWSFAQEFGDEGVREDPSVLAMTTDLVVLRPALMGLSVVGTGVWLVGLPFSVVSGNVEQATDTLIMGPLETTFIRCLGCSQPGHQRPVDE